MKKFYLFLLLCFIITNYAMSFKLISNHNIELIRPAENTTISKKMTFEFKVPAGVDLKDSNTFVEICSERARTFVPHDCKYWKDLIKVGENTYAVNAEIWCVDGKPKAKVSINLQKHEFIYLCDRKSDVPSTLPKAIGYFRKNLKYKQNISFYNSKDMVQKRADGKYYFTYLKTYTSPWYRFKVKGVSFEKYYKEQKKKALSNSWLYSRNILIVLEPRLNSLINTSRPVFKWIWKNQRRNSLLFEIGPLAFDPESFKPFYKNTFLHSKTGKQDFSFKLPSGILKPDHKYSWTISTYKSDGSIINISTPVSFRTGNW